MRLAFMGTPDFAVPILEALVAGGHQLVRVYAQPARPAGRGHRMQLSAVEQRARELELPVATPATVKGADTVQEFGALGLDAAVVAAYGQLLPAPMLEAPRYGCINVHASLLPRWRGAAPIQRAIMAGDEATGVSIMQMEAGLDTGPVHHAEAIPIETDETAATLQNRLADLGARLILAVLADVEAARARPTPQPEAGVTYAAKIVRADGELDWCDSARANERKVRALGGWPGASFAYGGERIKVLAAEVADGIAPPGNVIDGRLGIACADGVFRPTVLQRPGRASVPLQDFLNGLRIPPGTVLPCPATS